MQRVISNGFRFSQRGVNFELPLGEAAMIAVFAVV